MSDNQEKKLVVNDDTVSETISSPCIGVCVLDDNIDYSNRYCRGCLRAEHEVVNWINYSEAERKAIMEKLKTRKIQFCDD